MLNKLVLATIPIVPKFIVKKIADNYIAGEAIEDAVRVVKNLQKEGAKASIDLLGEYVEDRNQTLKELGLRENVIDNIVKHKLDATQSIKLTSLGLGFDDETAYELTKQIVDKANNDNVFIQIDMEDSLYTDRTIDFYKRLRADGYDNVGMVFQAYLKRTYDDIKSLVDYKPVIRICKGIYVESEEIAYKTHDQINDSFKNILNLLFENKCFVGIATHDEELINYSLDTIKSKNLTNKDYEFQMLLGVRTDRRKSIIKLGHNLRVYVSFGKDWYGYSLRRFKENPKIAGYVFKALFKF